MLRLLLITLCIVFSCAFAQSQDITDPVVFDEFADDEEQIESLKNATDQQADENLEEVDVVEATPENTHYSRTKKIKHPLSAKGLSRITKKKEYIYDIKKTPHNHSSTVLFSSFAPTKFAGNTEANGNTYSFDDIYSAGIMMTADYEWKLYKTSLGHFGIKFATGLFATSGQGIFKRDGSQSIEEISLYLFPNTATGAWKLKFTDKQWLIPYIEAGGGYYTFMEMKKDEGSMKFAGAPVIVGAGGVMLDLGLFSRDSLLVLDRDYGINGMLLTMEYRVAVGAGGTYNLSHNNISAGITLEY